MQQPSRLLLVLLFCLAASSALASGGDEGAATYIVYLNPALKPSPGPAPSSLVNTAPWIITVGAGTLDRNFPAYAKLGNGETHAGMSLYSGDGLGDDKFPLVYNKGIRPGSNASKLCMSGTLDASAVKGKVVLCDRGGNSRVEKGQVVKLAGGVGMVLANTAQSGEEVVADSHLLPAVAVGDKSGDAIRAYVESDAGAEVALSFAGTAVDVHPAPVVAAFSSRGPNRQVAQLLKPDVIGPGVNILAGWTGSVGPTGLTIDERRPAFNILSGTSMSCPHISGLAAFVKAAHPDWSPSAIKSALMTTAYTRKLPSPGDLNYPSFSVVFGLRKSRTTVKYHRELTNVGAAGSVYAAKVTGPPSIVVSVKPARLVFKKVGDKLRYTVAFKSTAEGGPMDAAFGWLTWSSGEQDVRSPISYTWGM
ncbi:Subtilisin-like protease [Triticum urartu]|uniref:Subtilisin-like protease n=1 Tax=Triticum urartu TaxID=4572 RepID=M8A820_TRIUA|nr:Subtilisin-like protease [Triticum urartu]